MQTTVELTAQTTVCKHLNSNITSITLKGSLSAIWTEIHCMTLLRWKFPKMIKDNPRKLSCHNIHDLKTIMAHVRIQMIPPKGYTFILDLIPATCMPYSPLETHV